MVAYKITDICTLLFYTNNKGVITYPFSLRSSLAQLPVFTR